MGTNITLKEFEIFSGKSNHSPEYLSTRIPLFNIASIQVGKSIGVLQCPNFRCREKVSLSLDFIRAEWTDCFKKDPFEFELIMLYMPKYNMSYLMLYESNP